VGGEDGLANRAYDALIGAGTGAATGGVLQSALEGIPAAWGAAKRFIGPQTPDAALGSVGEALGGFVTPQELATGMKSIKGDPLGAVRSSAEVTGSPELAILEQSLGSSADKSLEYAAQKGVRNDAQQFILDQVSPAKGVLDETSGQTALDTIAAQKAADKKVVGDLYDLIPVGTQAKLGGLKIQAQDLKTTYFGPGGGKMSPRLQEKFDFITSPANKGRLTINELKNARGELLDISSTAYRRGDNQEGSMASQLADGIKNVIGNAPKGAVEWNAANKAAAEYFDKYQGPRNKPAPLKDIAKILPSRVYAKIMSSPEAAKQYERIVNGQPQGLTAIKNQIASDLSAMTDAAKVNFIANHETQLKTILGSDYGYLKSLHDSIRSRIDTQKLANATANSNTALKLSGVVERALTGKNASKPSNGLWSALVKGIATITGGTAAYAHPLIAIPTAIAGVGAKVLRDRSGKLVQDALYQALDRPNVLKKALDLASLPKPIRQALSSAKGTNILLAGMQGEREKPKSFSQKIDAAHSIAFDRAKAMEAPKLAGHDREKLLGAIAGQESGGQKNPDLAVSPKGAIGRYQLMPDTAKALGVDPTKPEQAKAAAAQLLTHLYDRFKDTKLALAAYNYGEGNLHHQMTLHSAKTWDEVKKYVPEETQNYVPEVLARLA